MLQVEPTRHQVAIAGRVTDEQSGRALAGVQLEITAGPTAFSDWLNLRALQFAGRWASLPRRPDRTRTGVDGHFHFMDLPDGQYTLTAALSDAGSRYGQVQATVTVSRAPAGTINMATADMALPPTTVAGQITEQITDPTASPPVVVMAEVRVEGSGERTFTDSSGQYRLSGIEASAVLPRTILVTAQGYQPLSQSVLLTSPGAAQTLDFSLNPTP